MRTRTTAALTSALAFALLGACSRDVTLPPEPTAPRIQRITPDRAYAGQRIAIDASGLDAVADANLVQFPSAVARGESVSAGRLVVRVPADAGTGPIAVGTGGGLSSPAGPFTYLGLGQLRTGAVSGDVPLLHKPYRLVAAGGDTFLHSDLLLAIVRYSDPGFVDDLAAAIDGLPWAGAQGAVAWLDSDGAADPQSSRLVRLDLATGARAEADVLPFAGAGPIVAMRAPAAAPGANRIALLRSYASGDVTLALHDADTLLEVEPPALLPSVVEVRGCADAGEGQLACLVRPALGAPLSLALVAPGPSPSVQAIPLGTQDAVQEDPVDREDPICAGRTSLGARVAAVALDDGRVALAQLDGAPAFLRDLDTGSRTPARSLACATLADPGLGIAPRLVVVAPKRADDLVVAVDAEAAPAGRIAWSASVPRASRAAVDAASGTVHAAGEADNRVVVLDASGALLARRSFDVLPGRAGAVQAAAWIPAGGGDPAALVFAVGAPPGVVELPLAAAPGTFPVYRNRPDAVGVFGPFAPYDPSYRYYFTLRRQAVSQAADLWSLSSPAQLGQDGPGDAYIGTSGGLVTIDYPAKTLQLSPIAGATFASMGLLAGPRVFAAVGDASGAWTVRAWSEARAAAGGAAEQSWTSPGPIAAAALLDEALWVFHRDAAGAFVATQLDDALQEVRSVPMPEAFDRILAVSPNGRTFVTWEYQPWSWETSVVVWAAGGAAYERAATVPVQGVVAGVAFGGTGEALHVLTRSPDRVVVLE
ncbi:MAG TPA: IPT/TIG domain-containing protein [Anaeromyxobacter sp.]